jgi:hypothetical protein
MRKGCSNSKIDTRRPDEYEDIFAGTPRAVEKVFRLTQNLAILLGV